jgi:hypothetical protein
MVTLVSQSSGSGGSSARAPADLYGSGISGLSTLRAADCSGAARSRAPC